MNRIRFHMTPPGTAARLAEQEETPALMPRVSGGDAARLHEQAVRDKRAADADNLLPESATSVGFSLRAQGARVTRTQLLEADGLRAGGSVKDTARLNDLPEKQNSLSAAQTADASEESSPASQQVHRPLLSLVRQVQAILRRT